MVPRAAFAWLLHSHKTIMVPPCQYCWLPGTTGTAISGSVRCILGIQRAYMPGACKMLTWWTKRHQCSTHGTLAGNLTSMMKQHGRCMHSVLATPVSATPGVQACWVHRGSIGGPCTPSKPASLLAYLCDSATRLTGAQS